MRNLGIVVTVALCALMLAPYPARTAQAPSATPEASDAKLVEEIVYANRILADQGVLDGLGHVSARSNKNPDHFLMARSMAPALVTAGDVMEFDRNGEPVDARGRAAYIERYIHAAIYRARPDVKSVVHSHSPEMIPYGVSGTPLRPVYHMGAFLGAGAPVFDIQDVAGMTDMLVRDNRVADALAKTMGSANIVLMRGHGFAAAGVDVPHMVFRAIYAQINARVQTEAMKLGPVKFLSPEEAAKATVANDIMVGRSWDVWKSRVGKIE